ncbi:hypothetical protein PV11_03503 [Exophiala sideris]|uniref:Alpha/beta hydrolase fold-3 domain-containing protein n=1 Tax=Exophiala sideris TaxID=1016849 RepID=A0A0D1X1F2_9EURO|nr:hypothetical protein PV11_03503 [Exophiala sideris]
MPPSEPDNARYWKRSPEFEAFLASADLSRFDELHTMSLDETRKHMEKLDVSTASPMPKVKSEDKVIKARDGKDIPIRIWKTTSPKTPEAPPLAVIYHGGGWIYGGLNTEPGFVSTLVGELGLTAITVDYRLAPENPFPGSFNDSYDALQWARHSAGSIGADPSRIYVAGASAGANLAAAVTLEAKKNDQLKGVLGQVLVVPATCHYKHYSHSKYALHSIDKFAGAPLLSTEMMKGMWDAYYSLAKPDPRVSPLLGADHLGLPPTYIQVAGADPLCDEGIAYANCLRAAAVKVKLDIYPGLPHGSQTALLGMPQREKYLTDLMGAMEWFKE